MLCLHFTTWITFLILLNIPTNLSLNFFIGKLGLTVDSSDIDAIVSAIDPSKYWFMFPAATCVATCAITAGIGGAALFGPIFLILFPLLGPEYVLQSPAASVGIAILIETFGFSSGLLGYSKRGLIDASTALKYAAISVPVAYISSSYLTLPPLALKSAYTLLMIVVSAYMTTSSFQSTPEETAEINTINEVNNIEPISESDTQANGMNELNRVATRTIVDSNGQLYEYPTVQLDILSVLVTAIGGALCGVLGVGIGEVTLPQLLEKKIPLPVAAASSTMVVTLTCAVSAGVQISSLVEAGGITAIPWSLVMYMIPGVIIGAQIAATLQGRVTQKILQRCIGGLFGVIGVAFFVLTAQQSGLLS